MKGGEEFKTSRKEQQKTRWHDHEKYTCNNKQWEKWTNRTMFCVAKTSCLQSKEKPGFKQLVHTFDISLV